MNLDCIIRKKSVPATPEERVRQATLKWMIEDLGYPLAQIAVEKALHDLPHLQGLPVTFPNRRLDILVYHCGNPLLVMECKAEKIEDKALLQLMGYQHWAKAPFAALSGAEGVKTIFSNAPNKEAQIIIGLPSWYTLIDYISYS